MLFISKDGRDMNKHRLQQIIREEIINEVDNGTLFVNYPEIGAEFPMLDKDYFKRPEEIDKTNDYINFHSLSNNKDLDKDKFPFEELKKGVKFEKAKNPALNHFDVADIVISNLKDDAQFYSNMFIDNPEGEEFDAGKIQQDKTKSGPETKNN